MFSLTFSDEAVQFSEAEVFFNFILPINREKFCRQFSLRQMQPLAGIEHGLFNLGDHWLGILMVQLRGEGQGLHDMP